MKRADVVTRDGLYPSGEHRLTPELYRWTGEKRPPRRGEFYLSGAIVEAYRAPNDLDTPYHIAVLVPGARRCSSCGHVRIGEGS